MYWPIGFYIPDDREISEDKDLMQREITFKNKNFRHRIELGFKQVGAGGDEQESGKPANIVSETSSGLTSLPFFA